jgi:hypothetical protein
MRIALSFVLALALGSAAGAQAQAPSTASASAPTKAGKPARDLKASKPKPKPEVEAPEPESLEEERMAVAPMVLIGDSQCEFGQRISLRPHPTLAGRFLLDDAPPPGWCGSIRCRQRERAVRRCSFGYTAPLQAHHPKAKPLRNTADRSSKRTNRSTSPCAASSAPSRNSAC